VLPLFKGDSDNPNEKLSKHKSQKLYEIELFELQTRGKIRELKIEIFPEEIF